MPAKSSKQRQQLQSTSCSQSGMIHAAQHPQLNLQQLWLFSSRRTGSTRCLPQLSLLLGLAHTLQLPPLSSVLFSYSILLCSALPSSHFRLPPSGRHARVQWSAHLAHSPGAADDLPAGARAELGASRALAQLLRDVHARGGVAVATVARVGNKATAEAHDHLGATPRQHPSAVDQLRVREDVT